MFSIPDHEFMARALRLAEQGLYTTTPNPRVGCVIVREGVVVGEGFHARCGEPHAEVNALAQAGETARGATAYVTLEPCAHHGKTPPCADALIAAGVTRVVAAMQDPNPLVAGNGIARLRAAEVAVEIGLMEADARELNIGFVSRMTRGRPWVRMKCAASLDGRTALANGASKWITGEAARADVQRLRARACAMLTGAGTVLADDPQLNVRGIEIGRQPLRVVVDTHLSTPPMARLFDGGGVLIATACDDEAPSEILRAAGAEIAILPGAEHVDLALLMRFLADREINEVMVEAGAKLNGALLAAGLVDELVLYLAPSILGDRGRGLFGLPELTRMEDKLNLQIRDMRQVGVDLRITARLN
jgi:diaminohydroxyphosphoribosylaminopyrimidine deaminase / 5-amino-6-(5-phosphoribosylamino)uracil reductase